MRRKVSSGFVRIHLVSLNIRSQMCKDKFKHPHFNFAATTTGTKLVIQ